MRSLEIFPDDPLAHQNLGKHYLYQDRYEEAVIHLRRTTFLNPSHADSWKFLGMALIRLNRHAEAIPPLRTAVGMAPDDPQARLELGTALARGKQWEEAAVQLQAATQLNPQSTSAWYNLACALASLGNTEQALSALRKSIEHGFYDIAALRLDPDLENLRTQPEFQKLLELVLESHVQTTSQK
jgi:Flp pilus assembly protein TadD